MDGEISEEKYNRRKEQLKQALAAAKTKEERDMIELELKSLEGAAQAQENFKAMEKTRRRTFAEWRPIDTPPFDAGTINPQSEGY